MNRGVQLNLLPNPAANPTACSVSTWPPRPLELAVLADLGISDHRIAVYYRVNPPRVRALLQYYGLTDPTVLQKTIRPVDGKRAYIADQDRQRTATTVFATR